MQSYSITICNNVPYFSDEQISDGFSILAKDPVDAIMKATEIVEVISKRVGHLGPFRITSVEEDSAVINPDGKVDKDILDNLIKFINEQ